MFIDSCDCPYSWILNTSFWTGSANQHKSVAVEANYDDPLGFVISNDVNGSDEYFGVRPVIVIDKSKI